MTFKNEVTFSVIKGEKGTDYTGGMNEIEISNVNSHVNTYFNIDIQQSAYFTMMIEGFEYNRFHTRLSTDLKHSSYNTGRRDYYFSRDPIANANLKVDRSDPLKWIDSNMKYTDYSFDRSKVKPTEYWLPLKSLQYSQGSIEALSLATGTFSDLRLPFRKQSPTLTVEMYDHRSDFFEMKLREWHAESVLNEGFVPVLESITKKVKLRGFSTNGECNYITECDCILIDDVNTSRDYASNDLKVISFKMLIVGY